MTINSPHTRWTSYITLFLPSSPTGNPRAGASKGLLAEPDNKHFLTLTVAAQSVAEELNEGHQLVLPGEKGPIAVRNAFAYSNWFRSGRTELIGVLFRLRYHFKKSRKAELDADGSNAAIFKDLMYGEAEHWGVAGKGRLFGTWWIVKQTDEGAVLLPESGDGLKGDGKNKAYLVLGVTETLQTVVAKSRLTLPLLVRMTLLPFRGRLSYDGVIAPVKVPTLAEANSLRERADKLLAAGKTIDHLVVDLPHIPYRSKGDPNIDENLEHQDPATSQEAALVAKIKAVPRKKLKEGERDHRVLIFRRFGYTAAENPNKIVFVMDGTKMAGQFTTAKLEPTAIEILQELHTILAKAKTKSKPLLAVQVDAECVDRVRFLLKDLDFLVTYYPPPSPEEEVLNEATNPYMR